MAFITSPLTLQGESFRINPSTARTVVNERDVLLAGEGSKKERGRSPLSIISPPLKQVNNRMIKYGTV